MNKMKVQQAKLECDKRKLKEALEVSEQRATKLELARRAVEGDLQRNKLSLTDKETSHQVKNILVTTLFERLYKERIKSEYAAEDIH